MTFYKILNSHPTCILILRTIFIFRLWTPIDGAGSQKSNTGGSHHKSKRHPNINILGKMTGDTKYHPQRQKGQITDFSAIPIGHRSNYKHAQKVSNEKTRFGHRY